MTTGRINQIAFDRKTYYETIAVRDGRSNALRTGRIPSPSRFHFAIVLPRRDATRSSGAPPCADRRTETPIYRAMRLGYRVQTHGSTTGERGRDETSGRETVQRTVLFLTASLWRATRYGQRVALRLGEPGREGKCLSFSRGGPTVRRDHAGPGDTRIAFRRDDDPRVGRLTYTRCDLVQTETQAPAPSVIWSRFATCAAQLIGGAGKPSPGPDR